LATKTKSKTKGAKRGPKTGSKHTRQNIKIKKKVERSPDLNLNGPTPDGMKKFKVQSDGPVIPTKYSTSFWDHLIIQLDYDKSVIMNLKDYKAFKGRATNLGYVLLVEYLKGEMFRVGIEGFSPLLLKQRRASKVIQSAKTKTRARAKAKSKGK